ncbi:MAG: tetratricopeptide repeat protein, partial [bacterium]|nr:tetratricopeptide repeat protein [bacterium]
MGRSIWVITLALAGSIPSSSSGQVAAEDVQIRAINAYREGRVDEAFTLANQAIEAAPDDPTGYFVRGTVFENRQQYDKALADLNRVVKLSPELPLGYSRRGGLHFKLGDFTASIADFNREIQLDPSRGQNHWQRGLSYYYGGHYEKGWKQFELSVNTVNPNDYENGIYQFFSIARATNTRQARRSMLDITSDERVPMKEVYNLLRGTATVDEVFGAAESGYPNARELN